MPWYTFGKSPRIISERIATVCRHAEEFITLGDFSRMDGRVSNVGRTLTTAVLNRLFADAYHEELQDLMRSQVFRKCYTTYGVKYNPLHSRLSGSPETSGNNTLENAFICYLAWRMTKNLNGEFYNKQEAWEKLCDGSEFGGDDSAMADLPRESYVKAAAALGHKVTVDIVLRGELGVNFLSRFYGPYVWTGDPNNMCDLRRALSKFHTTPDASADPVTKMTEKSLSMAFTDSKTPIIGPYVVQWLELADVKVPHKLIDPTVDTSWWSAQFERTEQFINVEADWMYDYARLAFPEFNWDAFNSWTPQTMTEMLEPPLFSRIEEMLPEKEPVVVNGEVRQPEVTISDETPPLPIEEKVASTDSNPILLLRNDEQSEQQYHDIKHCHSNTENETVCIADSPGPTISRRGRGSGRLRGRGRGRPPRARTNRKLAGSTASGHRGQFSIRELPQ